MKGQFGHDTRLKEQNLNINVGFPKDKRKLKFLEGNKQR